MRIDKLLEKFDLKYNDLSPDERTTLHGWLDIINRNQLTIEKIREYIQQMKSAVEQELTDTENNNKQDIFLKARLKNYLLIEAFLSTPEKAKEKLEQALTNFGNYKK